MKTINKSKIAAVLSMLFLTIGIFGQAPITVEHDSDTASETPQILLFEDDASSNEAARIWFKNLGDPEDNRWSLIARARMGSQDADGLLDNPMAMAWNGVQKFSISKDGFLRINKEYILPNMDGTNGQILKTDGSGNISWSNNESTGLLDADGDTGIDLIEESATSSDTISFKVGATSSSEVFNMSNTYVNSERKMKIEAMSDASNPQLVLNERGKNNFTRLFFKNDSTDNFFAISTRSYQTDLDKNLLNLGFNDGSGFSTFFQYDADEDEINIDSETIIRSSANDANPNLLLEDQIDDNFTRLHFRNANISDRWSIAAHLGTTAEPKIGFYYNGFERLVYNETNSELVNQGDFKVIQNTELTGTLDVTGDAFYDSNLSIAGVAKIEDFMKLEPLTTAPTCTLAVHNGRIYFHGGITNKVRVCVNGSWEDLN